MIFCEDMQKTMQEIRSQGKKKLDQKWLEPRIHGTQGTPDLNDRNHTTCHRGKEKTTLENAGKSHDQHWSYYGLLGVAELQLKPGVTQQLCNIAEKGPEWWMTLQRIPTEAECDEDIKKYDREFMGDYDKR